MVTVVTVPPEPGPAEGRAARAPTGAELPPRGSGAPWRPRGEAPPVPVPVSVPVSVPAEVGPSRRPRCPSRGRRSRRAVLGLWRSISSARLIASCRAVPCRAVGVREHRAPGRCPSAAPAGPPLSPLPAPRRDPRPATKQLARPARLLRLGSGSRPLPPPPPHLESAIKSPILSFGNTNYLITPRCRAYLSAQLARTIIKIRGPNYVSI